MILGHDAETGDTTPEPIPLATAASVEAGDAPERPVESHPEIEAAEHGGLVIPSTDPVSRRRLILLIAPIIALVIANNIGNVLFATLSTENPLLLIALSPPNRNLILASHQVPLAWYMIVGFLRLMAPDFFFYSLGFHYGEKSIAWMERRTPSFGTMMRQLETLFGKAGHVLVVIMPNNPVCLIAGAARMRKSVFWTLNVVGTIGRLIVMWLIGEAFQDTVDSVLQFIQRYRVPILVVSILLVGFNVAREWRAGNSEIQQLMDLETQLEGETADRDVASPE